MARLAVRFVALVAAITFTLTATAACEPAPPIPVGGDEFDGTTIDPARWLAYAGTYGNSGGGSRHCLTPGNVAVRDGMARITARRGPVACADGSVQPYTSGFLGSRDVGRYQPLEGTFAIRARVPAAQGIWPAFWLRHRAGAGVAEVDVLELFHAQVPGKVTQTLHLDGRANVAKRSTWFEQPSATPGWHEFSVRIDVIDVAGSGAAPDVRFDFAVDGTTTFSHVDLDPAWPARADPSATWDLAVNIAVDGRWVGDPDGVLGRLDQLGRCAQPGTYPACPATGIRRVDWSHPPTFDIDWIRVTPLA